jgi:tRNA(Ile)-lysidine synthase
MRRPPDLYKKMKQFVGVQKLLVPRQHLAVAVSGGMDSVVLLDLLVLLSQEWNISLSIFHINHTLRGKESDGDEQFVRALADRYQIPVYVHRNATLALARRRKASIQVAARDVRYSFFLNQKQKIKADAVATAHTANDTAETFLLNLFRGTGLEGLGGIPAIRHDIPVVRPLLFATRKEIAAYARTRRLKHREDASNAADKYSRNYVRNRILSSVEQRLQPAVIQHIAAAACIIESAVDVIAPLVNKAAEHIVSKNRDALFMDAAKLKKLPEYVAHMIVHNALHGIGVEPGASAIRAIIDLAGSQRGTRAECGNGWSAERDEQDVVLRKPKKASPFRHMLEEAGTVEVCNQRVSAFREKRIPKKFGGDGSVEYVDADRLKFPLTVRSWRRGDSFVPLGMSGKKKVSDFFIDKKIPRGDKISVPIVISANTIVWIAGYRIDDRYKITTTTRSVMRLTVQRIDMENIEGS